jgi:competence protein ComEC
VVVQASAEERPILKRRAFSARSALSALLVVLKSTFIASAAVEALLFPLGALLFSRVTFAGLALNLLAVPLMAVAQVAGFAVVLLALASTKLAAIAGFVAYGAATGLVSSADLVAFVPAVTYRLAPPSWGVVALYYVALCVAWVLWRRATAAGSSAPRTIVGARTAAAVAGLTALWILTSPRFLYEQGGDGLLHATFIDVGQGDSVLLELPGGSTMLVDSGGLIGSSGFDIGDRVVAMVLREAGVRRLDHVVLTHGDPDHIGGMPAVVREFRPRLVWEGIPVPRSKGLAALRTEAQSLAAGWFHVYRGGRLSVDGVDIVVEHPAQPDWERQRVRNDDSIVLDVRWRDVSLLMTGDIGQEIERALAGQLQPAPLRIVKVPHHGSRTSSSPEFLAAIRPRVAVIGVGRSNHFGHPAPEVLERYREIGAEVFRTDRDGAIWVETDGYSMNIRTFNGRQLALTSSRGNHDDTKLTKP